MVRSDLPGGLASAAFVPPMPSLPWHTSHFCAYTAAPCAGVPLPDGRPLPSGGTLISHFVRSASLMGFPSPGPSAANAMPATSANGIARAKRLAIDILCLPLVVDRPTGDDVHVPHRERGDGDVDLGLAALGEHLGAGRRRVAGL